MSYGVLGTVNGTAKFVSSTTVGLLWTTFSPFGLETIALFTDGEWGYAALNIALSVVLCLVAVRVGQVIALQVVRG